MHISFIIPAYNEESLIAPTIDAIQTAARDLSTEIVRGHEIIVVNDASTDRTADLARQHGARVIDVEKRQIAAVRNAGAKEAKGDVLIFVDADTISPAETLRAAVDALRNGAVGGGCDVKLEGRLGVLGWLYFQGFLMCWRPFKFACGCFVFARRDAFDAAGGWDERFYAGEEMYLSAALKKQGRFVILRHKVFSSGRKARLYGATSMILIGLRLLLKGPKAWQQRQGLGLWYDGKRE